MNYKNWLKNTKWKDFNIEILIEEASLRKYYRLYNNNEKYILMDSSLDIKSMLDFINITKHLSEKKVKVPKIFFEDKKNGFLIIEDFGDIHYLNVLNKNNFKELYKKAIDEIIKIQEVNINNLLSYDKKILTFEINLVKEWFLKNLLNIEIDKEELKRINNELEKIISVVMSQPSGYFVHKDFHSRNILLTTNQNIGIIDFQDGVRGPITYDLVSLLKDCYIEFNENDIENLALYFKNKKKIKATDEEFIKWFDYTGIQRHLKVLGIFSGLYLIIKKDKFLKDIPLVLKYVINTSKKYDELKFLTNFFEKINLENIEYKKTDKFKGRIKELYYG